MGGYGEGIQCLGDETNAWVLAEVSDCTLYALGVDLRGLYGYGAGHAPWTPPLCPCDARYVGRLNCSLHRSDASILVNRLDERTGDCAVGCAQSGAAREHGMEDRQRIRPLDARRRCLVFAEGAFSGRKSSVHLPSQGHQCFGSIER